MESRPAENTTNAMPVAVDTHSSNQLLDPQLVLRAVKQARQAHQPRLREQLQQLREDIEKCQQFVRRPLQLFPREIWQIILNNLEDVQDVTNCAQSNNLLFGMLSSPQNLLFCKVLPHVVPFLGNRPAPTILNCGKVCRVWRKAVDRFADHYFRVETPPRDGIDVLTKEPVAHFPSKDMLDDGKWNIQKHPFHSEASFPLFRRYNDRLYTMASLGHCFWQVILELEPMQTYRSQPIYDECVRTIGKCNYLKRFRLVNPKNCEGVSVVTDDVLDHPLELQAPSSLEAIEILVESPGILAVQDALLQNLSNKLKCVVVHHWNCETYQAIPWTNLTELDILNISLPALSSLKTMTAPKLYKLKLNWNSNLENEHLFTVVNSFDRLRHLSITLTDTDSNNLLAVPVELLTANRVTTLEIYSKDIRAGLNIAVLFPLLQNLICQYGPNTAKRKEFEASVTKLATEKSYILACNNMYHSNIWTRLPKLEKLLVIDKTTININRRSFTRLGYIWATEKYSLAAETHLEQIRQLQKEGQRIKLKAEQIRLKNIIRGRDLSLISRKPKSTIKMDIMTPIWRKQSLPFIFPHLDQATLLSCRLVCKCWKITVGDNILDKCIRNIPLTFQVPLSSQKQIQNFISFVEDNMRKPFFARTVEIEVIDETGCVDGVEIILNDLGWNIRHLSIKTEISLELSDLYKVIEECMKQCSNMQSFSLQISNVKVNNKQTCGEFRKSSEIAKPKGLDTLSFSGQGFRDTETRVGGLRSLLKVLFGTQIKTLVVPRSFGEPCTSLLELTLTDFKNESGSHRYFGGVRRKLRKLKLCIAKQELCYRDLEGIIVNCNSLEYLELQFTQQCFSFDKNLVHWGLETAQNVTEIQIVFKNKYQICLDFLMHFPGVKTLRIIYGQNATLLNENDRREENAECYFPILQVRKQENDFIQLAKYFKDENVAEHNTIGIQESNVWGVLRKLKTLEIVYCPKHLTRNRKIFTRKP